MMLTVNQKMKKASLKTYNFDIPAGKTCIGADKCLSYCYAMRGFYKIPVVKNKHELNLAMSKSLDFPSMMIEEIKGIKNLDAIRIHSAGDFYSKEYLAKWCVIASNCKDVTFYAYTKSIPLFIGWILPDNMRIVYSTGGKYDHLIEQHDLRSCKVVDEYSDDAESSDDNDSMILFSDKPIELLKRKVI